MFRDDRLFESRRKLSSLRRGRLGFVRERQQNIGRAWSRVGEDKSANLFFQPVRVR
jgi:hypothetical protein